MNQNQPSSVQSESDHLSQLKKDVNIPSSILLDTISHDEQFIQKLKELNQSGISAIFQSRFQQSIIYLQQAQKMLEFAANCGKAIDRIIIIYTLHNQACGYQGLWEFEKTSSYLQAIIYNMNNYVQSVPELVRIPEILDSFSQSYNDLSLFIHKLQYMALNFLKFSAINSQLKKHEIAIDSAFKSLSALKLICEECYNYQQYSKKNSSPQKGQILKELSGVKKTVDIKKMNQYFKLVQKYLIKIKNKTPQNQYKKAIKVLDQFTISQVMQLKPISLNYLKKVSTLDQQISFMQKMYKTLYISICYFTVATQLRFICNQKYSEQQKRKTPSFLKSKLFHLNSIIIACKYLPKKIQFIDHLLKTFTTHYDIKLQESMTSYNDYMIDQNTLIVNMDQQQKFHDYKILKKYQTQNTQNDQKQKISKAIKILSQKLKKKKQKSQNKKSKEKCKSTQRKDCQISIKDYFNTKKKLFDIDKSKDKDKSKKKIKMSPGIIKSRQSQKTIKFKSLIKTRSKKDHSCEKSIQKKNKIYIEYFAKDKNKKKILKTKEQKYIQIKKQGK